LLSSQGTRERAGAQRELTAAGAEDPLFPFFFLGILRDKPQTRQRRRTGSRPFCARLHARRAPAAGFAVPRALRNTLLCCSQLLSRVACGRLGLRRAKQRTAGFLASGARMRTGPAGEKRTHSLRAAAARLKGAASP